jgi:hypothetical protein
VKIAEIARTIWVLFPQLNLCINFQKRNWAAFWATFSKSHLVTLAAEAAERRHCRGSERSAIS